MVTRDLGVTMAAVTKATSLSGVLLVVIATIAGVQQLSLWHCLPRHGAYVWLVCSSTCSSQARNFVRRCYCTVSATIQLSLYNASIMIDSTVRKVVRLSIMKLMVITDFMVSELMSWLVSFFFFLLFFDLLKLKNVGGRNYYYTNPNQR